LITELVGTVALYDMEESMRLGKRVQQALAAFVQNSDHEFKNFHRLLCDQIPLIEWIAKQVKPAPPVQPVAWLIPGSITTDPELAKANGDKAVALGKISTQQWNPEDHYKDGWRDALESVKRAAPPAAPVQPVAWLYPEGLEALQNGKCWTAYPTKHDDCNIPLCAPPTAQPAPEPLTDEDVAILEAVRREMEDKVYSKNAPGHAHHTPGIWDEDNGDLAGKPCAWCLTWKKFTGLIEREAAHGITAAPEKGQP
jgi:hypothetical protein